MMGTVVSIKPCANVSEALRNIADSIDDGDLVAEDCTLVIGTDVFHLGCVDDGKAAVDATFNLTLGIHKLMAPIMNVIIEE